MRIILFSPCGLAAETAANYVKQLLSARGVEYRGPTSRRTTRRWSAVGTIATNVANQRKMRVHERAFIVSHLRDAVVDELTTHCLSSEVQVLIAAECGVATTCDVMSEPDSGWK